MKKTNIRIDNFFIIIEDKSSIINYYKSDIDQYDEWNELPDSELKKYKGNKITTQVKDLIRDSGFNNTVNFILLSDQTKDLSNKSNNDIIVSKLGGGG
tara:strand:+ start:374 stop:667 length:294 start_codon:yes stop_codon:yes gene_type:complete